MKGSELIRRARKFGRKAGVTVRFVEGRGKGSHGTLYFGDRKTIVKDRGKEITRDLFHDMCRQLGIDPKDL